MFSEITATEAAPKLWIPDIDPDADYSMWKCSKDDCTAESVNLYCVYQDSKNMLPSEKGKCVAKGFMGWSNSALFCFGETGRYCDVSECSGLQPEFNALVWNRGGEFSIKMRDGTFKQCGSPSSTTTTTMPIPTNCPTCPTARACPTARTCPACPWRPGTSPSSTTNIIFTSVFHWVASMFL